MKLTCVLVASALVAAGWACRCSTFILEDCGINLDGTVAFLTSGNTLPQEVQAAPFDTAT